MAVNFYLRYVQVKKNIEYVKETDTIIIIPTKCSHNKLWVYLEKFIPDDAWEHCSKQHLRRAFLTLRDSYGKLFGGHVMFTFNYETENWELTPDKDYIFTMLNGNPEWIGLEKD